MRKAAARVPSMANGGPNEFLSVVVLLVSTLRRTDIRNTVLLGYISSLSADHFARMMKETSAYLAKLGSDKLDLFEAFHFTSYNIIHGDTLSNQMSVSLVLHWCIGPHIH